MGAPKRKCRYCYREIYRVTSGDWYHRHNASTACLTGSGGNRAEPITT